MSVLTKEEIEQLKSSSTTTTDTTSSTVIEADRFVGDLVGTATLAKKLQTPFKLALEGDVSGSGTISGDTDVIINTTVSQADHSLTSDFTASSKHAENASLADLANIATYAIKSGEAVEAEHAVESDHALLADKATLADNATHSEQSDKATADSDGNNIINTYATIAKTISTDDYIKTGTVIGKAFGSAKMNGTNLDIVINSLTSETVNSIIFSSLPESPDTTKMYADAEQGVLLAYDASVLEWKNIISAISTIKADISTIKADIVTNNADIVTNKADISTIKADIVTNNANAVHITGNESISGVKTFNNTTKMNDASVSGAIYKETTNSCLELKNGTGETGACALLYGSDHATTPGYFSIGARKGSGTISKLVGSPDGSLTWNGHNIVRSINGKLADSAGNVQIEANSLDIGTPGTQGFGVGIYPGTDSELTAIGLSPMSGYSDLYSDNYGNYMHYKGGQMIFVPAFYFRYGSEDAAQYATYGSNSLEVKNYDEFESQTEANAQGFYLHRAFIDGGEVKKGFFISKYHMTVTTVGTQSVPISGMTTPTANITPVQMMDYARGLGYGWNCPSAYMMSAIDILAMCHGQFATWTNVCKWYDPSEVTTYPAQGRGTTNMGLYSHNGQASGLMGFEYYWEFCCGFTTAGTSATQGQTAMSTNDVYILKSDKKLADLTSGWGGTTDAWGTTSTLANMHDVVTVDYPIKTNQIRFWGNTTYPVFTDPSTDNGLSLFGILPCNSNAVGNGVNFIAKSVVYTSPCTQNLALYVHGQSVVSRSYEENSFARNFCNWRVDSRTDRGFRCAGYAL